MSNPLYKTKYSPLKDIRMQPEMRKINGKRVLIIVESPKKINKIKSCLPNDNEYKVLPTVGHIVELGKCGAFNLGINLQSAYEPKFVISTDKVDVLKVIIDSAKTADKILIATDPDREGEFIGFSVVERLGGLDIPIKRIEIRELTKKGILDALSNEKELDIGLIDASISRRVLDRIVGFLVSPLLITRFGDGLSAGRVQSVALRLLVDKELEIEGFVPENYWNINIDLYKNNKKILAKYADKVISQEKADKIVKELKDGSFIIDKITKKEVKKPSPLPITTSRLQMLASSRFGFGAQRTMKAAQKLYEDGLITYIRTDSVRQSDEAVSEIREWINYNKNEFLPKTPIVYANKGASQDAHESIRPTSIELEPLKQSISDEQKLYKLIWETTIASQMTPAVYEMTNLFIKCNNKNIKASGKVLKHLGWLSITKYSELEKEDEKDISIPEVFENEELMCRDVVVEKKSTNPPSRYTEGTLIKELEKRGIGRPSTYADITNKIINRKFVSKKGNSFVASSVGKKLINFLVNNFKFMQYDFTVDLEKKLDEVAKGNVTYVQMIQDFYPKFKKNIEQVYLKTADPKFTQTCNQCGEMMYLKSSKLGFYLSCSNYPDCNNSQMCDIINGEVILFKDLPPAPSHIKCDKCSSKMVIVNNMFGKFYICSQENDPKCNGRKKIHYGKKCPNCDSELYRTVFYKPPIRGPVLCCESFPKCRYIEQLDEGDFEAASKQKMEVVKNMRKNINLRHKDFFFGDVKE